MLSPKIVHFCTGWGHRFHHLSLDSSQYCPLCIITQLANLSHHLYRSREIAMMGTWENEPRKTTIRAEEAHASSYGRPPSSWLSPQRCAASWRAKDSTQARRSMSPSMAEPPRTLAFWQPCFRERRPSGAPRRRRPRAGPPTRRTPHARRAPRGGLPRLRCGSCVAHGGRNRLLRTWPGAFHVGWTRPRPCPRVDRPT